MGGTNAVMEIRVTNWDVQLHALYRVIGVAELENAYQTHGTVTETMNVVLVTYPTRKIVQKNVLWRVTLGVKIAENVSPIAGFVTAIIIVELVIRQMSKIVQKNVQ